MRYILRKLLHAAITLFLAILVTFVGVRALPGDPAIAMAGSDPDPGVIDSLRESLGLNEPIHIQFFIYAADLLRGDWGRSTASGELVVDAIMRAMPVTMQLAILSMAVAALVGIALGIVAAVRQGKFSEWVVNGFALLGLSLPNFWLGLMAVLFFAVIWPVLPASGYVPFTQDPLENLRRMVLPVLVLSTAYAAVIMRMTRSSMLESLTADYIRTAKAKGVSNRALLLRHALRNSLIVVVTVVGLQLGSLIVGAVIIEQVFVIPGMGSLMIDSVNARDYPMIQAVVFVVAAVYIAINLLTDALYAVIDPRIRVTGGVA